MKNSDREVIAYLFALVIYDAKNKSHNTHIAVYLVGIMVADELFAKLLLIAVLLLELYQLMTSKKPEKPYLGPDRDDDEPPSGPAPNPPVDISTVFVN